MDKMAVIYHMPYYQPDQGVLLWLGSAVCEARDLS
jgi:hypothetical protein